jgi:D-arabinose 1-dehydrogenase-like Zn-dependent alcohol dehydrogenase
MKAAIMREVGAPLSLEDVPLPRIGPDEVLVESHSSGICGTDLHILAGHGYVPALPHILGHEPAGVVVETGRDVTSVRLGDRVVPHLFSSCNTCVYCRSGRTQQCANLRGILGVLCAGAFAEYFKSPAENLFVLPALVPFDAGGLIADAVVTGLHAVRRADLKLGDSAVVLGAGGVGQIVIQLLAAAGIRVAAVDRAAEKLPLAREMGATAAFDAELEAACAGVAEWSGGDGVQCVFNCAGTPDSMHVSARLVMRCGCIVVIGEEPGSMPLETTEIAQRELEIIGSRNGTRQDMADAVRMVAGGIVRPYVAARFPLERINDAFDCVRRGALGRVVVVIRD